MKNILNYCERFMEFLEGISYKLFPQHLPEGEVICNVSRFNSRYNAMALEASRMEREGASEAEVNKFVRDYRKTHSKDFSRETMIDYPRH